MNEISFDDFLKVELRVGKIISAEVFPGARRPAYILHVDFGEQHGVRKASAQITDNYAAEDLLGRLVVGVINFPAKQIGPIQSQCLVTGFYDKQGNVALCVPDRAVPLGSRLL
jgi:tRNA-binding protein